MCIIQGSFLRRKQSNRENSIAEKRRRGDISYIPPKLGKPLAATSQLRPLHKANSRSFITFLVSSPRAARRRERVKSLSLRPEQHENRKTVVQRREWGGRRRTLSPFSSNERLSAYRMNHHPNSLDRRSDGG